MEQQISRAGRIRHPEREQAILRVAMGTAVLLAFGAYARLGPSHAESITTRLITSYVGYGALILLVVDRTASAFMTRLVVTTIADQAFVDAALAAGGSTALRLL
jgi:hypothetical protein